MKTVNRYVATAAILALACASAVSASGFHLVSYESGDLETLAAPAAAVASGVPRNMPVIGRLLGAEDILFRTSVDIQNNTDTATLVTFWIHGNDLRTGEGISAYGNITNDETDTLMKGMTNFHSDDLIADLVDQQFLPASLLSDGFLGSAFAVFQGFGTGQGSLQARFYSEVGSGGGGMSGGTIGVSMNSNDIGRNEPRTLYGVFRDTRGLSGTPQLYSNMFLNNVGYVNDQSMLVADTIDVRLTAYSTTTCEETGVVRTVRLAPYQTVGVPEVVKYMGISPPGEDDTIIVKAEVVSGLSAIQGVGAIIDQTTKDPSGFEMHEVRPVQTTVPSVAGTWNVTFTIIAGSGAGMPPPGSQSPGRMTLVTSGSNVSGTLYGSYYSPQYHEQIEWGMQIAGTVNSQGVVSFTITQITACAGPMTGPGSITLAADGNHINGSYSGHDNCGHSVTANISGGRIF